MPDETKVESRDLNPFRIGVKKEDHFKTFKPYAFHGKVLTFDKRRQARTYVKNHALLPTYGQGNVAILFPDGEQEVVVYPTNG